MDSSVLFSGALDIHPVHIQRAPVRLNSPEVSAPPKISWAEQPIATSRRSDSRTSAFAVFLEATLRNVDNGREDADLRTTVEDVIDDAELVLEDAGFRLVRSMSLGFLAVRQAAVESGTVTADWRGVVTLVKSVYARLQSLADRGVQCAIFVHADSTLARPFGSEFSVQDEDVDHLLNWMAVNADEGIQYTTGSVRDLARFVRRQHGIP